MTVMDHALQAIPNISQLYHFKKLRILSLVHTSTSIIQGLDELHHLEELYMIENNIENMFGIEKNINLRILSFGCNSIRKITSLTALENLESLFLYNNKISKVEGLDSLKSLKVLNLAGNNIKNIGTTMDKLISIKEINLGSNKVTHFKEIINLTRLSTLQTLILSDPHFGDNPVCMLSNYQTYVLYYLSQILCLDTLKIQDDARAFAEATFMKKRMYYNMRIKSIQKNTTNIVKVLKIAQNIKIIKNSLNITNLVKRQNEVMREYEERTILPNSTESEYNKEDCLVRYGARRNEMENPLKLEDIADLLQKKEMIDDLIRQQKDNLRYINSEYESLKKKIYRLSEENISRLVTELETGGNIRFEEGKTQDKWFISCIDLVKSRFNKTDMEKYGVEDIEITSVTRIHNRFLRNAFDDRLEKINFKPETLKKKIDYLFCASKMGNFNELSREIEAKSKRKQSSAVFTNSVNFIENERIRNFLKKNKGESRNASTFKQHLRNLSKETFSNITDMTPTVTNGNPPDFSQTLPEQKDGGDSISKSQTPKADQKQAIVKQLTQQTSDDPSIDLSSTTNTAHVKLPDGQILICKVIVGDGLKGQSSPTKKKGAKIKEGGLNLDETIDKKGKTIQRPSKNLFQCEYDDQMYLPEYLVTFKYKMNANTMSQSESDKLFSPLSSARQSKTGQQELKSQQQKEKDHIDQLLYHASLILEDSYLTWKYKHHEGTKQNQNQKVTQVPQITMNDMERADILEFLNKCDLKDIVKSDIQLEEDKEILAKIDNEIEPVIPKRTKITDLTIPLITFVSRCIDLKLVTYLNLFNNKINKMIDFSTLQNLETLILSFNEIKKVEGIQSNSTLMRLELNHNFLYELDKQQFQNLKQLHTLNLSNNWLTSFRDLDILSTLPQLTCINFNFNPISTLDDYISTVFQIVPSLEVLDGSEKEELEEDGKLKQTGNEGETLSLTDEIISNSYQNGSDQGDSFVNRKRSALSINEKVSLDHDSLLNNERDFLVLNHMNIKCIKAIQKYTSLRRISLIDNCIEKIEDLSRLTLLEDLNLESNRIKIIENLDKCFFLKKLNLAKNQIKKIQGLSELINLTQLSLEDNQISTLSGIKTCTSVMELYLNDNIVSNMREVWNLTPLTKLMILDLSGNQIATEKKYRHFTIFHVRRLRVLDGQSIDQTEYFKAKEKYNGRLTAELLDMKVGGQNVAKLKELDLSNCKLRDFERVFEESMFPKLVTLNLQKNFLTTLKAFGYFPKLRNLNLSQNKITTLFTRPKKDGYPIGLLGLQGLNEFNVSQNLLKDMQGLQYPLLKVLKTLNISFNEIKVIECLNNCTNLEVFLIQRNRIKQIYHETFEKTPELQLINISENNLKYLMGFENCKNLNKLMVQYNKISEVWEFERLSENFTLKEISALGNPITKVPNYRHLIFKKLPFLLRLDGVDCPTDGSFSNDRPRQIYQKQQFQTTSADQQPPRRRTPNEGQHFEGVYPYSTKNADQISNIAQQRKKIMMSEDEISFKNKTDNNILGRDEKLFLPHLNSNPDQKGQNEVLPHAVQSPMVQSNYYKVKTPQRAEKQDSNQSFKFKKPQSKDTNNKSYSLSPIISANTTDKSSEMVKLPSNVSNKQGGRSNSTAKQHYKKNPINAGHPGVSGVQIYKKPFSIQTTSQFNSQQNYAMAVKGIGQAVAPQAQRKPQMKQKSMISQPQHFPSATSVLKGHTTQMNKYGSTLGNMGEKNLNIERIVTQKNANKRIESTHKLLNKSPNNAKSPR